MAEQQTRHPYALLGEIEARSRRHALALPQPAAALDLWHGIRVRVGTWPLLAPLDEVREILACPALSAVPRAKPWVRGVTNVRGTLLPVIDLAGYFGAPDAAPGPQAKLLIVGEADARLGLLVHEALGLQHFPQARQTSAPADLAPALRPYVTAAFEREGTRWPVLSLRALISHPDFLRIAA